MPRLVRRFALLLGLSLAARAAFGGPIAFTFTVAGRSGQNPFARELWAEVQTPSGRALLLPAYYDGDGRFAVHARPDEVGVYRLGRVSETGLKGPTPDLPITLLGGREVENRTPLRLPSIRVNPADPRRFVRSDGRLFIPVGANVAWAEGAAPVPFYRQALTTFARANLNWMRIWMVHWGGTNLDWLPAGAGPSPKPGALDPRVAATWDEILATAEQQGVYVQIVLQHHGQYSTQVNSNWAENPWNAANPGGFLHAPTEFFTSPDARIITMLKYRYIVARWGWSPAVFAWELFNEVHWVDAMHAEHNEAVVARWHDAMADYLRSIDVYGHLITTSTDDVRSPIYAKMDYYQPHLYPGDLLVAARGPNLPAGLPVRPVFYGEAGDDNTDLSAAVRQSGGTLVPPAWAGLMGAHELPALPWLGAQMIRQGRASELGAVLRFAVLARFGQQRDLRPFSPAVESAARAPLVVPGVQGWRPLPGTDIDVPADGRIPLSWTNNNRIFVGNADSLAAGFPGRATYRLDLPQPTTAEVRVVKAGAGGTAIRIVLDGKTVAEKAWAKDAADLPSATHPAELGFSVPAGRHVLEIANPGHTDWFELSGIHLGVDVPMIAAFGQRSERYLAVWLWNRDGVFRDVAPPATGTLVLDDVPAGPWTVTWWDTLAGKPTGTEKIEHSGGALRLPTPPIARHAAVVLTR